MLAPLFRSNDRLARARSQILAHRALLFARTALRRGDYPFAAARLAEGFGRAPLRALRIAVRRAQRNRRQNARVQAGLRNEVGSDDD